MFSRCYFTERKEPSVMVVKELHWTRNRNVYRLQFQRFQETWENMSGLSFWWKLNWSEDKELHNSAIRMLSKYWSSITAEIISSKSWNSLMELSESPRKPRLPKFKPYDWTVMLPLPHWLTGVLLQGLTEDNSWIWIVNVWEAHFLGQFQWRDLFLFILLWCLQCKPQKYVSCNHLHGSYSSFMLAVVSSTLAVH